MGAFHVGLDARDSYYLALLARNARAALEIALDVSGWPWSPRLPAWLDAFLILEEASSEFRVIGAGKEVCS